MDEEKMEEKPYFGNKLKQNHDENYESAGLVIWRRRRDQNGIELLLGLEKRKFVWGFFGGKRDPPDIDSIQTAIREFYEETGKTIDATICNNMRDMLIASDDEHKLYWRHSNILYIYEMDYDYGLVDSLNNGNRRSCEMDALNWFHLDSIISAAKRDAPLKFNNSRHGLRQFVRSTFTHSKTFRDYLISLDNKYNMGEKLMDTNDPIDEDMINDNHIWINGEEKEIDDMDEIGDDSGDSSCEDFSGEENGYSDEEVEVDFDIDAMNSNIDNRRDQIKNSNIDNQRDQIKNSNIDNRRDQIKNDSIKRLQQSQQQQTNKMSSLTNQMKKISVKIDELLESNNKEETEKFDGKKNEKSTPEQKSHSYHIWQYSVNNGWENYQKNISMTLETKYKQNSSQKYHFQHSGNNYEIDFGTMYQINTRTKTKRKIQRTLKTSSNSNRNNHNKHSNHSFGNNTNKGHSYNNNSKSSSNDHSNHNKKSVYQKWQWQENRMKNWYDYEKKVSINLKKLYQQDAKSLHYIKLHDKIYEINFQKMIQINIQTKFMRNIRMVPSTVKGSKPVRKGPPKNHHRWNGPRHRRTFGNKILTLYHSTDASCANLIVKSKKMLRGQNGMFGGGIYFAESKQQANHKAIRRGCMLTCKVFVGKEFVIPAADPKYSKLTYKDLRKLGCDSVHAPNGAGNGGAERVVYNYDQVVIIHNEPYKN